MNNTYITMEGWRMRFSRATMEAFNPEGKDCIQVRQNSDGCIMIRPSDEGAKLAHSGTQRVSSMKNYDLQIDPFRARRMPLEPAEDGWWIVEGLMKRESAMIRLEGIVEDGRIVADVPCEINGNVVIYIKNV